MRNAKRDGKRRERSVSVGLIGRKSVFRNSKFEVFSDHIRDSAGREVTDYLVVSPLAKDERGVTGVAVLPIQHGNAILQRMFRHPAGQLVLEVPRGFLDAGESPAQAASRELREETGLICPPGKMIPLGFCFPEAGILTARVALFAAPDCEAGEADEEGEPGLGGLVRIPLAGVRQNLANLELDEATTCLCLHRYLLLSEPGAERPESGGAIE